jgi:hypothetical protein
MIAQLHRKRTRDRNAREGPICYNKRMSLYWIPILVSAAILLVGLLINNAFASKAVIGGAMLALLVPLVQGNAFSFSYTSIFTLCYAALLILTHFLSMIPIKNKYMGSLCRYLLPTLGIVFSIPAIFIYGAQGDHYQTYVYVAIGIGVGLGIAVPFLIIRNFWKCDILSKMLAWLFYMIGFAAFSYCFLSAIQSRYLVLYCASLFAALAGVATYDFDKTSSALRYAATIGVAIFVVAPLVF